MMFEKHCRVHRVDLEFSSGECPLCPGEQLDADHPCDCCGMTVWIDPNPDEEEVGSPKPKSTIVFTPGPGVVEGPAPK